MKRLALVVIILAVIAAPGAFAQDAARLLKAAINTEMVDGDPKAAIEEYKKVVASGNRALAAQALLRMAGCYQKLGDAEARKIYARIVRDFVDQSAAVEVARTKIGLSIASPGLQTSGPFATRPPDARLGFDSILSPDGMAVIELSDVGLIERDLATNRERVILSYKDIGQFPQATGEPARRSILFPVWSRSSREVAFVVESWSPSAIRRELRVSVRATGEIRSIPTLARARASLVPLAWTVGGDIAYSLTVVDGPDTSDYFLVSSSGGESRRILQSLSAASGDQFGDLVPDGTTAVVVKGERLSLVDLATGAERPLTQVVGAAWPRVSPDGRLVAFLSKLSGRWALYVAPLDQQPIRNPVWVANLDPEVNIQNWRKPSWTTGGHLTLNHETGGRNVYRIDIDPQTARPLGPPQRLSHALPGFIAWVSPDSKHVAYQAGGAVAVMAADGSQARRLTPSADSQVNGWRTPTEIVYIDRERREPDGNFTMRSVDINSGQIAPLPFPPRLMSPGLQFVVPSQEVFHAAAGKLMARSQVDGRDRILGEFRLNGWRLSRDGTWLGTRLADGTTSLFRIENGTATPIGTLDGGNRGLPRAWSPKGTHLVVEADQGGLRIVEIATMQSWPLVIRPGAVDPDTNWAWWGDADWAPDGSFIVASMSARRRIRLAFEGVTYEAVSRAMSGR